MTYSVYISLINMKSKGFGDWWTAYERKREIKMYQWKPIRFYSWSTEHRWNLFQLNMIHTPVNSFPRHMLEQTNQNVKLKPNGSAKEA